MELFENRTHLMRERAQWILAESNEINPVQVIASMCASGIPIAVIFDVAMTSGISSQLIEAGIERGEAYKSSASSRKRN